MTIVYGYLPLLTRRDASNDQRTSGVRSGWLHDPILFTKHWLSRLHQDLDIADQFQLERPPLLPAEHEISGSPNVVRRKLGSEFAHLSWRCGTGALRHGTRAA